MTLIEEEKLKSTREYKAAMELENAVNDMSFNYKNFAKSLRFMHPTLQQNIFRLIKELIIEQADENNERYFDGRNQASHELAKKLLDTMRKEGDALPFI